jgi:hypothetical protein
LLVITFSIFIELECVIYRLAIIRHSRKAMHEYYERQQRPDALLVLDIQTTLTMLVSYLCNVFKPD